MCLYLSSIQPQYVFLLHESEEKQAHSKFVLEIIRAFISLYVGLVSLNLYPQACADFVLSDISICQDSVALYEDDRVCIFLASPVDVMLQ